MAGKTKKFLTCKGCKRWEPFAARKVCCSQCGAKFDLEADVSHWKGNTLVRGSQAWDSGKANAKGWSWGKNDDKGSATGQMKEGPLAQGCKHL